MRIEWNDERTLGLNGYGLNDCSYAPPIDAEPLVNVVRTEQVATLLVALRLPQEGKAVRWEVEST